MHAFFVAKIDDILRRHPDSAALAQYIDLSKAWDAAWRRWWRPSMEKPWHLMRPCFTRRASPDRSSLNG
ncbi:MAG: hypothetical protein U0670_10720 [Anaerolineae bacterium]